MFIKNPSHIIETTNNVITNETIILFFISLVFVYLKSQIPEKKDEIFEKKILNVESTNENLNIFISEERRNQINENLNKADSQDIKDPNLHEDILTHLLNYLNDILGLNKNDFIEMYTIMAMERVTRLINKIKELLEGKNFCDNCIKLAEKTIEKFNIITNGYNEYIAISHINPTFILLTIFSASFLGILIWSTNRITNTINNSTTRIENIGFNYLDRTRNSITNTFISRLINRFLSIPRSILFTGWNWTYYLFFRQRIYFNFLL